MKNLMTKKLIIQFQKILSIMQILLKIMIKIKFHKSNYRMNNL